MQRADSEYNFIHGLYWYIEDALVAIKDKMNAESGTEYVIRVK